MLAFYAALARSMWRLLVSSFPAASSFLAIVLGVAGIAAAVAIIAFSVSGASRAGWIQAERMLDTDGVDDADDDEDHDFEPDDALQQVAVLVSEWQSLSPEERENAVEILRAAASDDTDEDDYEAAVDETLEKVVGLIDEWHSLSPMERENAVELLRQAADDYNEVPF